MTLLGYYLNNYTVLIIQDYCFLIKIKLIDIQTHTFIFL